MNIENVCGDETGRNTVDAAEINPFNGQALGHLDHTSFGSIVLWTLVMTTLRLGSLSGATYRRLFLGHIHQRCADRCREDNVAVPLLFENSSSSLSSIKSAIKVDIHDIPPLLRGIIFCCGARCDPGVDDNNVQFPKVFGNLLYRIFNFPLITNIGFVCCSLHIILGCDFCGGGCGGIGSVVDEGDLIMSTALF